MYISSNKDISNFYKKLHPIFNKLESQGKSIYLNEYSTLTEKYRDLTTHSHLSFTIILSGRSIIIFTHHLVVFGEVIFL